MSYPDHRPMQGIKKPTKYGWLVERITAPFYAPLWLCVGVNGLFTWTPDANRAIRFSRQEDADQMTRLLELSPLEPVTTEHGWPG